MKRFLEIVLLILCFLVCGSCDIGWVTGPDDSDNPDAEVLHSFKVEYHRPQGSIVFPNGTDPERFGFYINHNGIQVEKGSRYFQKVDENVLISYLENIPCSLLYDKIRTIDFETPDYKRTTDGRVGFGDDFVLINMKTGVAYKLTKVIKNTYSGGGTMARCNILYDGSVTSEVQ